MEVPLPELPGVEHRYVDAGGLRTHVAETGDGPPLVLLHGWPQHWWGWHRVVPLLRDHFRLVMPDLRGHGWTAAPPSGYDKEQLATDVLALLDALGIDRARIAAHDWGGWVAFLLALREPERVERMVTLNIPPPMGRADPRAALGAWRFWYQGVLASPFGARLVERGSLVRLLLTGDRRRPAAEAEDVDPFVDVLRDPARARASQLLYRTFLTRELPAIVAGRYAKARLHVPTRMLHGTGDFAIGERLLRGAEQHADDLEVELVDGSGHFIIDEKPELVADRIRAFLG
jgi:pimeloyl-ACP methyl ester carboxylesterase